MISIGDDGNKLCHCGRPARAPHCPNCGSRDVRKTKQRPEDVEINQLNGERIVHGSIVCRRCTVTFNTVTWGGEYCFAPIIKAKKVTEQDKRLEEVRKAAYQTIELVTKNEPKDYNTKLQAAMAKARAAGRDVIPEDFD